MKATLNCLGAFFSLLLASLFGVQTARSTPITYTLSGVGSGSLGGVSFSDAAFAITAFADTSQIDHPLSPVFRVTNSATSISISGIGAGTLLTNSVTLDFQNLNPNESGAGIFLFYQGPRLLALLNPAFQNYELNVSLAPHSGTPGISSFIFPTTAGDFSFSSVSGVSFAATLAPEPSALGLLVLPVCLLRAFRARRKP